MLTAFITRAEPNSISLAQVTDDVSFLASDKLKGRGNFSPEISQAANYIAMRFKQSGLTTDNKLSDQGFLQTYQVTKNTPEAFSFHLNGIQISAENITMVSTEKSVSWQMKDGKKNNEFVLHNINKDDDMRAAMGEINQLGGKHVVLLNPAHKALFTRYKQYFDRGLTKLVQNKQQDASGGTLIIALNNTLIEQVETLNISATNSITKSELTNVVAVLPGHSKPNEIVLYSAHYDHLGVKSDGSNAIYNGADDDASGTAAIINIAQYYAKANNNARTLMFVAFSAEEIGGFGSKYFSQQIDPKSITAMINIEMIGKPSKFGAGTVWMTGMERSNLGEQLNNALEENDKQIYKDPYPEQNLFYRSDNATLARLGVPAHSFSSTQLDKDEHYHQVTDDLASLNIPSLHKVIEALAKATKPLVSGKVTPSRIDINKVKRKGLIY